MITSGADQSSFQSRPVLRAAAFYDKSVIIGYHSASHCPEIIRNSGDPVCLLNFEFGGISDTGRTFSSRGHHCDRRDLVDQGRDHGTPECDAVQRGMPHQKVSGRLCVVTDIEHSEVGSHADRNIDDARSCRIDPDIPDQDLGAGDKGSRSDEVGGGGDITRNGDFAGAEFRTGESTGVPAVFVFK